MQDETYTLRLAKAIEACRVYDASEGHQKAFREIQGGEVAVSIVQKGSTPPAQCYNCGESRHRSSQGCPAGASTCRNCGAMGLWAKAKACPRKSASRESSRSRYRSKSRYRPSHRGRYRGNAAVAVVGARMMTAEAPIQFNRFKVKTRASPRSHTMQSISLLVHLNKCLRTQQKTATAKQTSI